MEREKKRNEPVSFPSDRVYI